MLSKGKYLGFLIITLLWLYSCGGKKNNTKAQKKIEVTITGLDGNGIAEKKITDDLMTLEGVKTISFNYLNNQVVVLFDTTVVTQSTIISKILQSNEGKHKVLDVKVNTEPLKKQPIIKPDPQEDIHDDTGDQYKDNG
jgi:copper chaperone CopZ